MSTRPGKPPGGEAPGGPPTAAYGESAGAIFDPLTYSEGVPHGLFARLRKQAPVSWLEEPPTLGWPGGRGFWSVLRHEDVKAVLRDWRTFSSEVGGTQVRDYDTEADLNEVRQQILNMDPPRHDRVRRLMSSAFTPKAVSLLEARIERHAAELVAHMRELGELDFVKVAADLPLFVLAEVLGVPPSDRYLLYDWSNRVIGYQDPEYSTSSAFDAAEGSDMARRVLPLRPSPDNRGRFPNPRTRAGVPDLYAYARELASYKRAHPGDDVMSILLGLTADGQPVSDEEFENLFWLFTVAGNETIRNGIGGTMMCLLDCRAAYANLRSDPLSLPKAIEEALRFWPPVVHFRRTATRAVILGDTQIAAGDKVVVWHVSANRDEAVFADPDRFDIGRTPNDHVSFGFGPHFCLGAHLARCQLRSFFRHVLVDLPEMELAGQPVRLVSNFQNGLKHLPVRPCR